MRCGVLWSVLQSELWSVLRSELWSVQVKEVMHGGLNRVESVNYANRGNRNGRGWDYCNDSPTRVTDRNIARTVSGIKRRGVPFVDSEFNYSNFPPSVANMLNRQSGGAHAAVLLILNPILTLNHILILTPILILFQNDQNVSRL